MDGAALRLGAAKVVIDHRGSRGSLAENLLRELIAEFLPKRWVAGTGFVADAAGNLSRQVDVLVFDQFEQSAIYRDGDFVVLGPDTAKVAIEIKSKLDKDQIPLAYKNIASVKRIAGDTKGIVFGYDSVAPRTFARHVRSWEKKARYHRSLWPDHVFNMGGGNDGIEAGDNDKGFHVLPLERRQNGLAADRSTFVVARPPQPAVQRMLVEVLLGVGLQEKALVVPPNKEPEPTDFEVEF